MLQTGRQVVIELALVVVVSFRALDVIAAGGWLDWVQGGRQWSTRPLVSVIDHRQVDWAPMDCRRPDANAADAARQSLH